MIEVFGLSGILRHIFFLGLMIYKPVEQDLFRGRENEGGGRGMKMIQLYRIVPMRR
jgi:hypothetical protein